MKSLTQGSKLNRLKFTVMFLEKDVQYVTSGRVISQYKKFYPIKARHELDIDLRKELKRPNFILTSRGWRVNYVGRIAPYNKSSTGLIIFISDGFHVANVNGQKKGRISAKEYDPINEVVFGKVFHLKDTQVFKLFEEQNKCPAVQKKTTIK